MLLTQLNKDLFLDFKVPNFSKKSITFKNDKHLYSVKEVSTVSHTVDLMQSYKNTVMIILFFFICDKKLKK